MAIVVNVMALFDTNLIKLDFTARREVRKVVKVLEIFKVPKVLKLK